MKKRFRNLARMATTLTAGLVVYTTSAHAGTVFDNIGNYMYGGFTGPLAKAIAVTIFALSCIGMKHAEGRAFQTAVVGGIASGGVLAAPILTTEFQRALGGMITIVSSLPAWF